MQRPNMYNLANISNYFPINSISVLTYIKKKKTDSLEIV